MRLDLLTALRQLRRAPGTTLASVVTLAVGIGATTSVIAFLLGLVPMWLMHRVSQWYYARRIGSLENAAARAAAMPPPAPPAPEPVPEELKTEMPPPAEPDPLRP